MNETDKLITDQFDRLPKPLQQAINTVPWKSSVNEISLLKTLPLEQIATVERETMFIIYGFENPDDYIANIMREAQIDEATATAIAEEVNEKVLNVIALKAEEFEKQGPTTVTASVPEISPHNLPMVEPGGTVHDVPHTEPTTNDQRLTTESQKQSWVRKPWNASVPTYKYPGGKDPYHEPLQ
ncbi:MAG: hypothetical protein Q7R67_00315 [bacterium]|nr:hypothetical protein [bacterium]